jgi:hypothetical protein
MKAKDKMRVAVPFFFFLNHHVRRRRFPGNLSARFQ